MSNLDSSPEIVNRELPFEIELEVETMKGIFKSLDFERYWQEPNGKKVLVAGCGWTAYEVHTIFPQKSHGEVLLLDDEALNPISLLENYFPKIKFSFIPRSLFEYFKDYPLEQQFDLITFVNIPDLGEQLNETNTYKNILEEFAKRLKPSGLLLLTGDMSEYPQPHYPSLKLVKKASLSNFGTYPFDDHQGFLFQKSSYSGNRHRF